MEDKKHFKKSSRPMNTAEWKSGMPREILEYLEKNTELAKTAIGSHKSNFKHNLLYIFAGFILSLIPLTINSIREQTEKELLLEQFVGINASYQHLEKELLRMRSEYDFLKTELNSLRIMKK